jgi:hypothetical protein
MSISGLGDEPPDDPNPARPDYVWVIRNALREMADAAYPDDNAKPYQETLAALTAGEIAVTSLRAEGLVVVNRDDLKALLEGKASPDQWMQLAAVIGVSR